MKIISNDETHLRSLDELMRVFGSAKRYAFNRLLEERNEKDIIKHLPHQFRCAGENRKNRKENR
jgi:predicted transposase